MFYSNFKNEKTKQWVTFFLLSRLKKRKVTNENSKKNEILLKFEIQTKDVFSLKKHVVVTKQTKSLKKQRKNDSVCFFSHQTHENQIKFRKINH